MLPTITDPGRITSLTYKRMNLSVFGKMLETLSDLEEGLSHPILLEVLSPKIAEQLGLVEEKSNDDGKVKST